MEQRPSEHGPDSGTGGETRTVDGGDSRTDSTCTSDGGYGSATPASDERARRFRSLFVDVTGTGETVAEQETTVSSRDIDDETAAISTYVTAVAREDGLTDTIDEPDSGRTD